MKLSHEKPPNYDDIKQSMGDVWEQDVALCFGDTIHTKRTELLPDVIVHEKVHENQQGFSPQIWWQMYLKDKDFRYSQELAAYTEQAKFIKRCILDRNARFKCLQEVAKDFASPIYGPIISYQDALRILTK